MSNPTSNPSKAVILAKLRGLIAGLQQEFPNGTLPVGGTSYAVTTLVQTLQGLVDAIEAADAAQLVAKKAIANAGSSKTQVLPLAAAVRRLVLAMFTSDPQKLAAFAIAPPKVRAPKTGAENAAAAAKAEATRKARGTLSPKAKKAIKGNVTGVEITPIAAPAAPLPAAQPTPAK